MRNHHIRNEKGHPLASPLDRTRRWALYLLVALALLAGACSEGSDGTEDTTDATDAPAAEAEATPAAEEPEATAPAEEPEATPADAAETDTEPVVAEPTEAELDVVKGTYSPIAAYAPLFVGIEEGFFADHGIRNELDQVRINEALPLVASGDYDWGRSENSPGWFNALNSGLDVYGVVDRLTYTCSADNTLVVSDAAYQEGIRTFEDLDGRNLGIIAPGTQAEFWLSELYDNSSLSEGDIEVIYLDYADQLASLGEGNLDAAFMLEPLLTQGLEMGTIHPVISMLEVTPDANIGTMFFGGHFGERDDGDVATRWVAAWLEAARFAQDPANRDAVLAAVQEWTEVEPAVLESIYDGTTTWPQVDVNGIVDPEEVLSTQGQFMLDGEFIDELPPADRVFNDTFVQGALEMVGEVDSSEAQLCAGGTTGASETDATE